jgi:energy-coupling factor transporter ATP-binding protein EcfA2
MLTIGKNTETKEYVYLDAGRSRAVLICGKRGSGKSYTLGVLVEEILETTDAIVVIIEGKTVKLLVPGEKEHLYGCPEIVDAMQQRGVQFQTLQINPSDLTPDGWCDLFDMTISEPMGMVLYRSVSTLHRRMRRTGEPFTIPEIITEVSRDKRGTEKTKEAVLLRLETAMDWGFFATEFQSIFNCFEKETINIIDLSVIDPGRYGLRNLVVDVVCRDLFRKRTVDRRREELNLPTEIPRIWLALDEAHQFVPSGRSTLSKETLIRWVKEGRQPGLSLIVASQQPAAIDKEIISQCDSFLPTKSPLWKTCMLSINSAMTT